MNKFMSDDFLLTSGISRELYHKYAADMPIFDYHCHLDPREIAENKKYENITEIWLGGDHYKWRAMRSNGIDEKYITGDADPKEKFLKWTETIEKCIGNPLYHWSHLELKKYFRISEVLNSRTAEKIWNQCNEFLKSDEYTARSLIEKSNVKVICTTDDPVDTLEHHALIAGQTSFKTAVVPTFRPDNGINIESSGFPEYVMKLEEASGLPVTSFSGFLSAMKKRMLFFHERGCRLSDHALESPSFREAGADELETIFRNRLTGKEISVVDSEKYKTAVMLFLGREYSGLDWCMQLHIGTTRNRNTRMFKKLGPNTGFDTIGGYSYADNLIKFLDVLDSEFKLPRTILYSLNPCDNDILATMIGCFQGDGVKGKLQFGSAWWFNDNKTGMISQMVSLANMGLLANFVGMLTDSRSFLSYTRHDYFRRILCNLVGEWAENGEVPEDYELLGTMIRNISYCNAVNYFGISLKQ